MDQLTQRRDQIATLMQEWLDLFGETIDEPQANQDKNMMGVAATAVHNMHYFGGGGGQPPKCPPDC